MKMYLIEKYKNFLPINSDTPLISMGEGFTPLVKSRNIVKDIGCKELYFKLEGCNPSGSFKDRGMVMAVSKALEKKAKKIICASTGNTSASAAAFGAYCDLETIVLIPEGKISLGKLSQTVAYGAKIISVRGNFDQALNLVKEIADKQDSIELVNSLNPNRIHGQKTGAFEIVDELGYSPDYMVLPVGNAGNITAYWEGYKIYHDLKNIELPKMTGFQAMNSAPIVNNAPVKNPQTIATAIRIGNPASWNQAKNALEESNGSINAIEDDRIIEAYKHIASMEGIFVEPASSITIAGLYDMKNKNYDFSGQSVVCVLTGSGLKDPGFAETYLELEQQIIDPDINALEEILLV
jgi:threonine synthase